MVKPFIIMQIMQVVQVILILQSEKDKSKKPVITSKEFMRNINVRILTLVHLNFDQFERNNQRLLLMPRLKKHSHLKQNLDEPAENQQSSFRSSGKLQDSNKEPEKPSLLGRKMKYRQRVKILKEFDNRQKSKDPQETQQIQVNMPEHAKKVDMGTFLDKFTDDDAECSDGSQKAPTQAKKNKRQKKEKKEKREIKVANKFFTEYQFEEMDVVENPAEAEQLLVQKRQPKNPEHLLMKVDKKAENYKNRLDFKNFGEDIRFKQDMKEKLKSIEGCDEVNLVIEVPKVFTGKNSHADAALFIKNVRSQNQSSHSQEPLGQDQPDESSVPRDRKNFYEGLAKKMKMKKAETLTESILKECFKKSRLDDDDYLLELDINPCDESRHQEKIEKAKRTSSREAVTQSRSVSRPEEKSERQQQKIQEWKSEPERKEQEVLSQDNIVPAQQENKQIIASKQALIEKTEKAKQKQSSQSQQKPVKEKNVPQKKNQKNMRRMRIKDLIEQQAEDSDDGLPKKKGQNQQQEENSDDDDDLSSLLDDDITICEEQQGLAHRKFVKDMIELEEMKFLQMQKKYIDQKMQQQERLRLRMEAAARKNRKNEEAEEEMNSERLPIKAPSQPSESSISNGKNLEKIKQLEIDLGLVKPNTSQSNPVIPTQSQTVSKAFSGLQQLLKLEQSANFIKASRNGLLNLDRMKAKKNAKNAKNGKK